MTFLKWVKITKGFTNLCNYFSQLFEKWTFQNVHRNVQKFAKRLKWKQKNPQTPNNFILNQKRCEKYFLAKKNCDDRKKNPNY